MSYLSKNATKRSSTSWLWFLLAPDKSFYQVAIIYSLAISLLTLAVPIAVQTLINSLANVNSLRAIAVLSSLLFFTLIVSGTLIALRTRVLEFFERRIYARLSAEVSLHTIYAKHEYFEGRRNTDITNRYFDIMILQKNMPALLVDGFALLLQMLVGFLLVSFYHPLLLLFNTGVVFAVFLFWKLWGGRAVNSAVMLSEAKYEMSKWLDGLAYAHEFFKSSRHIDYAIKQTDQLTHHYIEKHKRHFKYTFSQTISFIILYALASAGLLGIGGWLVTIGQLSLGQLVAAELILSAILFGLSQTADYLKNYYEMCGAADELRHVFSIPQENLDVKTSPISKDNSLVFDSVTLFDNNRNYFFDFTIPSNAKVIVNATRANTQRAFVNLLKGHAKPSAGAVSLAGCDFREFNLFDMRQDVAVVNRSPIVECTIQDFLNMASPDVTMTRTRDILKKVHLLNEIESLPKGFDTLLSPLGDPLSPVAFLHLKLAAAILNQPKILVMTQFFDLLNQAVREQTLALINELPVTVLYFTQHEGTPLEYSLSLDDSPQKLVKTKITPLKQTPLKKEVDPS